MRLAIVATVAVLALLATTAARAGIPYDVALGLTYVLLMMWWPIPAGLLIELPVLWRWFGMSWRRAIMADLVMNMVSILVGFMLVLPLFAASHEAPVSVARTIPTVLLIVLIRTLLEYGTLGLLFRSRWTWTRAGMLYAANFASVAILLLGLVVIRTLVWFGVMHSPWPMP